MTNQPEPLSIPVHIINQSSWLNNELQNCLNKLSEFLGSKGIKVKFSYKDDESVQKSIIDLLRKKPSTCVIDAATPYLVGFQTSHPSHRVIVFGERLNTQNPYGDALPPLVAAISKMDPKVIWHETAHLLGALDHYDCDSPDIYQPSLGYYSKSPITNCTNPQKCIMQWNATRGDYFCDEAIQEIKKAMKFERETGRSMIIGL